MLLSFLTVSLGTTYLGMYWTDLYLIFRIGTYTGGHDNSDLSFAIAQGMLPW